MKSGQWFFVFIGLLVGFWGGRFWSQQTVPAETVEVSEPATCPPAPADCKELTSFLGKMKDITPEQIREYLKIQSAEEKLKRADEILGQIMAAMVADVGFKLTQQDLDQFGTTASVTSTTEPEAPTTTLVSPLDKEAQKRGEIARLRLQIRSARTEAQAMSALQKLGTNFSESLASTGSLSQEQIRELRGSFEGTLSYNDKRVVRTTMNFNGRLRGNQLQGSAEVQIYDAQGKVVSNSTSRGDLSGAYTGSAHTVFVEIGSSYLQLVYFPQMDMWMGNYLQNKKGSLVKTGTVVYQKR